MIYAVDMNAVDMNAVDMNLLSRFVVRFEVNFYNSKDSCEGSG